MLDHANGLNVICEIFYMLKISEIILGNITQNPIFSENIILNSFLVNRLVDLWINFFFKDLIIC